MAELHIFDFDGTLFRSPSPPATWTSGWWGSVDSLTPPCVPAKPDASWWISSTVSAAKRSIGDSDVFAVMMTGRDNRADMRFRVADLLKMKGLDFDAVFLSNSGDSIGDKKRQVERLLHRYPGVDTVRFWDDRPSHLRALAAVAEKSGIDPSAVHTELVRARSKTPLCGEEEVEVVDAESLQSLKKKCRYVAIFLDAASKAKLAHAFPFAHDKIQNDHVTLCLKAFPGMEEMLARPIRMKVIGYAEDEKGQAVVVDLPRGLMQDDRTPHVTLSHHPSVGPEYSNRLLAKGWDRSRGPSIKGIVDMRPSAMNAPFRISASRVAHKYLMNSLYGSSE